MAITPHIVVLDIQPTLPGIVQIRTVFWFDEATAYPKPGYISTYQNCASAFPTVQTALQSGTMIEETQIFFFPQDWVASFWANCKNHIFSCWQDRNNVRLGINAVALPNAGAKYQIYYDTTAAAWSA